MVYCPLMRIAVIGLGFMGSTHLKAWKNIPEARLWAVVSQDEKKLAGDLSGIQGNIGGPGEKMDFSRVKKYHRADEALADAEIDAVDICLPTDQHAPVALAALRAGKHVLVEKPMALDGGTADELVAEACKSARLLMTGQVLRFIGAYRKTAERVKSGGLGAVRSALFRRRCAAPAWSKWLGDPAKSGGGVFDLLIHDVDYCVHLLGKPTAVSATGYERLERGIDVIVAEFHYPSIGSVVITGGWHHPKSYPFSMEFTIVGEEGTLEYSSEGRPLAFYGADGEKQVVDAGEADLFTEELRYFTDCVMHGKKPDLCPPEESALAVKLTRLMVESRNNNGERMACKF
jgi:predicted dehydrogenase